MKKYILLFVCLMSSIIVSATGDSIKEIIVQKDTTIVISDIYPNQSIVGQITKWDSGRKSAQLLCGKKQKDIYEFINKKLSHWLEYNDSVGLKINVIYNELEQISEARFSLEKAAFVNNSWTAMSSFYFITIKVKDINENTGLNSTSEDITKTNFDNTSVTLNNSETDEAITTDSAIAQENTYSKIDILFAVSILIIMCLIFILFISVNKLRKGVKHFDANKSQSSRKSEDINVDKIKQSVISNIKSEELAQRISDEDIYSIVNRSDIQMYIQTIIAGKVDEYVRNNRVSNPIPTGSGSGSNQQPSVVQPELRTTKVEYRADNNCFVIAENSQNKIFEIYSINGEYYYTIVKDSSIRKEMLGFITAFSGYVETRQASPIPSTVEVIRDGRLIKNGDIYIVDTNCILQVSLM